MASAATMATERYHQKRGKISKSYKLSREIVEEFAEACENIETTQAKELEKFMKRFIRKHHTDYE